MKKGSKPKRPKQGSLLTQRNQVRGLIAAAKSTEVVLSKSKSGKDKSAQAQQFQRSLAALLVRTREGMGASHYGDFLGWLERQTSTQLGALRDLRALDSVLLREVLEASPLPLSKEIQWTVARLMQHIDFIKSFVREANLLEGQYWSGDWSTISAQLDVLEKKFGRSLWLLEARLVLQQEFVGLESQKRIAKAEKKYGPKTATAYIAFHLSVRNEPTTVISRHFSELSERISKLNVDESLKAFLKFKLVDTDQQSGRDASSVLKVAQSFSEVDLYECLIRVCQSIVLRSLDATITPVLEQALTQLSIIGDERIDAMLHFLRRRDHPEDPPVEEAMSRTSLQAALRVLQRQPRNPRLAVWAAGQLCQIVERPRQDIGAHRWPLVVRQMGQALQFGPNFESDVDAVDKYFANHRIFRTALACHYLFKSEITVSGTLATHLRDSADVAAGIPANSSERSGSRAVLESGGFELCKSPPRWVAVRKILFDLQRAIEVGDTEQLLKRTCSLVLTEEVPLSVLPLAEAFGSLRWRQLKSWNQSLALSIALHVCWQATDSDLAATNLRFAYDEFLDVHGLASATDLVSREGEFNRAELIYFLWRVCVVGVMDMSQRLKSSRAVEEERKNICAALIQLDPINGNLYQDELVRIIHAMGVQDGRSVVDSSRVHVDTNAIRSWAIRELQPTFLRYAGLVQAGVGVAEDLESLLRRTLSSAGATSLEVPDSEADTVLLDLLLSLRDKFLLDPQHGLDSYLSRRVRHHSMTGYIRGPVEEARLITSRNTANNRYAPNTYWIEQLGYKSSAEQADLNRSFSAFAEEFDKTVLNLKNRLFHVKSEEHPSGLFSVQISVPMMHLARSVVQSDMSLDALCQVSFSMFWQALDSSLKDAQRHLVVDTKRELSLTFQRLRAGLRRNVERDRYEEASIVIARAAESVQREIDKMASWFVRREIQQVNQTYGLERVLDIAIESALLSHRPFNVDIEKSVTCPYHVKTGDLIVLAEIVLTVLGNVKHHASTMDRPKVKILVSSNMADDHVVIRVESQVGPAGCSPAARARVESIRKQIQDGSYVDKIRQEGGSGLMKLASIAAQSDKEQLDFGFIGDEWFFVETPLRFIEQSSIEGQTAGRLVA